MGRRSKKYWRLTETEYNAKLRKFVLDQVEFINNNLEDEFHAKEKREKVKKDIDKFYSKFNRYCLTEEAIEFALDRIIIKDVKDWSRFSLDKNANVEDIVFRILLSTLTGKSFVCVTMEAPNPKITDDVWKDIAYIRSGLFRFDQWDDKHVNAIVRLINYDRTYDAKKDKKLLKLYTESQIPRNLVFNITLPDHILEKGTDDRVYDKVEYDLRDYINGQIRRLTVNF